LNIFSVYTFYYEFFIAKFFAFKYLPFDSAGLRAELSRTGSHHKTNIHGAISRPFTSPIVSSSSKEKSSDSKMGSLGLRIIENANKNNHKYMRNQKDQYRMREIRPPAFKGKNLFHLHPL